MTGSSYLKSSLDESDIKIFHFRFFLLFRFLQARSVYSCLPHGLVMIKTSVKKLEHVNLMVSAPFAVYMLLYCGKKTLSLFSYGWPL